MVDTTLNVNFSIVLMGLSLHILIWEKLPDWGTWFNTLIANLPKPLAYLYDAWHCPYCFGFWVALMLHLLTGQYTLLSSEVMPAYLGAAALPIAWFLDALVGALLILFGSLLLKAISGPALTGHQKVMAFKQAQMEKSN
ncbi:hypothetical protein [Pseudoalteromonas luteoviolacea]|uniref:DUF1360 domain-containing protein n=1 Tax=Pseudoalteromonas luteoviolacea NCIMB 1942 TaxID=1365253 RepID=A0A161XX78_9GAMM|nr:hypothetical protein [Pseudoalteromonas luteoviolacea]KZN47889.1 hypothetical protein N482_01185 [Pseudoalteromonas luteoviolacea NCIMB 1942]